MPKDNLMDTAEPLFHEGETRLQTRFGVAERMRTIGPRMIRDHLPEQHRRFHTELPFLFLGARDSAGRPWATVLSGRPGFIDSPDANTLHIAAQPVDGDPLAGALVPGRAVGGLGIMPWSRRRNRFVARVAASGTTHLRLHIEQAFGNCPQHITPRGIETTVSSDARWVSRRSSLNADDAQFIRRADTFFVASAAPDDRQGADVSHRGGPAGFVQVNSDGSLTVPDYSGNNLFNTLGNLMLNPRAGLLFLDWSNGDALSLTGTVEITFPAPDNAEMSAVNAFWNFHPAEVVRIGNIIPYRLAPAAS